MSGVLIRPRQLVPAAFLGLVAISAACQNSDKRGPDTAASGGAATTGGVGQGGSAGAGTLGSGGGQGDDGSFGKADSGDAGTGDGVDGVAEDAAKTDSVSTDGGYGRVDAGIDSYSGSDLPAGTDQLVKADAGTDLVGKLDAAEPFWPGAFVPDCTPSAINGRQQADGHHRAGEDCMKSGCHLEPDLAAHHAGTDCRGSGCHTQGSPDGSGAPAFLFAGTIYRPSTLLAAPSVEIAVRNSEGFFSACSASNGNFWQLAPSRTAPPLAWSSATTRVRSIDGETVMTTAPTSGCNAVLCHGEKLRLTSP